MKQSALIDAIKHGCRTALEISMFTHSSPKAVYHTLLKLRRKGLVQATSHYPAIAGEPARKYWELTSKIKL
jgi:predicted transcriptional regulator